MYCIFGSGVWGYSSFAAIYPIDLLSLLSSLLRSGLTDENALGLVSAGLIATLACASRCCHQVLGILMATHGLFL